MVKMLMFIVPFSSSEDESGENPVFGQLHKSYVDSQVPVTDSMVVNVS